jgi:hypothetical protein
MAMEILLILSGLQFSSLTQRVGAKRNITPRFTLLISMVTAQRMSAAEGRVASIAAWGK